MSSEPKHKEFNDVLQELTDSREGLVVLSIEEGKDGLNCYAGFTRSGDCLTVIKSGAVLLDMLSKILIKSCTMPSKSGADISVPANERNEATESVLAMDLGYNIGHATKVLGNDKLNLFMQGIANAVKEDLEKSKMN